ncbi:hypothetical protein AURDEDRAFT_199605 [Auricularia subglabra TFB-10046 SS5]|nr:hypothetical protein AURDEDRAFT_199605 [Auricularia subglabra TFB-10046 SS5]
MLLAILTPVFVLTMGVATKQKTRFKNLVTFGDSYTDVVLTGDGGVSWPTYTVGYAGVRLFPFARAGAAPDGVPAFIEGRRNGSVPRLDPEETLYTLWIGTNDVGVSALISGGQAPGVSLVDTTACAVNWVKTMYDLGARHFLFRNMIPLDLTPLYSPNSYPNRYWALGRNTTEWSVLMSELTRTGNALSRLMLRDLAPRLPGSRIGLFNSHALFTDMHRHPARYFNGTAPLNVTGSISACVFQANGDMDTASCSTATGTDADSFLWFDELHPSEQADRIVAEAVAAAMTGSTRWTLWLG